MSVSQCRVDWFSNMRFVCLHLILFGLWIVVKLPGVPWPHFDPTYVGLAMAATVLENFYVTVNHLHRKQWGILSCVRDLYSKNRL